MNIETKNIHWSFDFGRECDKTLMCAIRSLKSDKSQLFEKTILLNSRKRILTVIICVCANIYSKLVLSVYITV